MSEIPEHVQPYLKLLGRCLAQKWLAEQQEQSMVTQENRAYIKTLRATSATRVLACPAVLNKYVLLALYKDRAVPFYKLPRSTTATELASVFLGLAMRKSYKGSSGPVDVMTSGTALANVVFDPDDDGEGTYYVHPTRTKRGSYAAYQLVANKNDIGFLGFLERDKTQEYQEVSFCTGLPERELNRLTRAAADFDAMVSQPKPRADAPKVQQAFTDPPPQLQSDSSLPLQAEASVDDGDIQTLRDLIRKRAPKSVASQSQGVTPAQLAATTASLLGCYDERQRRAFFSKLLATDSLFDEVLTMLDEVTS